MSFSVRVTKITDSSLVSTACSFTIDKNVQVKDMKKMYKSEHSPIRTQLFMVELYDIPTYVSTHFVRHSVGVEHFVKSNREDRGGDKTANRNTPVNHMMFLNAQALINMARKRLCKKASYETVLVMYAILEQIVLCDFDLSLCMLPDCEYRGGCYEFSSCGYFNDNKKSSR